MTIQYPVQVYSFTDFSISRPAQQQPGDRLDAQFANHATILTDIINSLAASAAKIITASDLDPSLVATLSGSVQQAAQLLATQASTAAADAADASKSAATSALSALSAAAQAAKSADVISTAQDGAMAKLDSILYMASGQFTQLLNVKAAIDNSQNDAALAAAQASDYAVLAQAWAENMPDTIPPNILAIMNITGSHWSSRWWALQAQNYATAAANSAGQAQGSWSSFNTLYLGPHANPPTTDNTGQSLQTGAIYYNTTNGNTYVWNGTSWTQQNSVQGYVPEAPMDGILYGRKSGTWVAAGSGGGIPEAPINSNAYARKATNWVQLNASDVVYGASTVASALAATAQASDLATTNANLSAETNARVAADNALTAQINGLTSTKIANASTVTGSTVTDALNTNATAITSNTTQINLKAPIASPVFTGNPQVPTPAAADNSTSIADTAWTNAAISAAVAAKPSLIVGDTAPASPIDSTMWWQSNTGYLYLYYNDGNSRQWVQMNGIPSSITSGYVAKTGDTMTGPLTVNPTGTPTFALTVGGAASYSGNITITKPWNNPGDEGLILRPTSGQGAYIIMDHPAGGANAIYGKRGNSPRWGIVAGNNTNETGSNVGSDFSIDRYSDAAALIDSPIFISRSTGNIILNNTLGVACTLYTYGGSFVIRQAGSNSPTIMQIFDSSNNSKVQLYFNHSNAGAYWTNVPNGSNFNMTGPNCSAAPAAGGNFICNPGQGYQTTGGPWASLSDARIKTVQGDYTQGLAAVLALHPVTYKFKGNSGFDIETSFPAKTPNDTLYIGLVAQEAEVPMPEMVDQKAGFIDGQPVSDLRSLDTGPLTFALVNAVKELSAQISNLQAEIAALKGAPA